MIKPLIILFNTVSVFLFSFFFGDTPVTVMGNFPKTAKANTEFVADIVINKGSLGGFAKLQMEVPAGFSVKDQEVKGGSFSFENNIAKIIWTATPSDAEFTVKFKITPDASASGMKTITSKFSYINNNAKEIVEMKPAEVTIENTASDPVVSNAKTTQPVTTPPVTTTEPVTTTSPVTPTETSPVTTPVATTPPVASSLVKTDTTYFETGSANDSRILCKRSIGKDAAPNVYNVEVKIKKGDVKGFAKYQELLPEGYTITPGVTSGSSFSVSDGKAKFVWVSLPPEEEMTISYKLEKQATGANETTLTGGEFSYLENDQSKKVKLPVEYISTSAYATIERLPPTYTTTPDPVVINNNTGSNGNGNNLNGSGTNNTTNSNGNSAGRGTKNTNSGNATTSGNVGNANSLASKNEGTVSYLVQIGAFVNAIQSDVLARKFNVTEPIKSEFAQGFSKFMVGMFSEYKDARSHRENMKEKGCRSAFVVAYNGPKRITVQEALTITSQKWFQ